MMLLFLIFDVTAAKIIHSAYQTIRQCLQSNNMATLLTFFILYQLFKSVN